MSYCSCEHGLFPLAGRKKRGEKTSVQDSSDNSALFPLEEEEEE